MLADIRGLVREYDITPEKLRIEVTESSMMRNTDELGIISLTEGVETKEQFEMLSGFGCMLFQGYHFSKPVPQSDFEKMIRPVSV